MSRRRDWKKVGEVVGKINELGLSLKEGAEKYGVKVGLLYEYNKRQKRQSEQGARRQVESLAKSSVVEPQVEARKQRPTAVFNGERPGRSKDRGFLPREVVGLISEYRRSNPEHGFKRIQDYLKSKYLVVVTRKQIRRVLKEHGLLETRDSSFDRPPEPARGARRFEASYPRQLYQMDVTYVYITGVSVLYLVVIVDDNSRFCVAADLCADQRGTTLIEVLHNACGRNGKPEKLLTDQASGFYSWSLEHTVFQKYLDDMRIEHIVSDPHRPQTCGKVERLIQTIKKELVDKVRFSSYEEAKRGVIDYIHSYNFDRPHQGIGGARPSDRFYGVIGEKSRIESELVEKDFDLSKGYLVYKVHDRTLSVVCCSQGMQVYLDGNLLKEELGRGAER